MRLIDAEKLLLEAKEANQFIPYEYASGWNDMLLNVIKAEQIDAVPVVRCRECKYRFKNNGHDKSGCPIIDANIWMDDDDFCSHGERKEGADNR